MNRITFFSALVLGLSTWLTFAQQPQDSKGHFISAKGDVYFQGARIGLVTKDKIIMDAKGNKLAFIDGQGNLVDAKTGKKMGKTGKNGETYYDANGALIFTVKDKAGETCDIFDAKGKKIGSLYDGQKGSACAIHCFKNGLDVSTHQKPIPKVAKNTNK